MVLTVDARSVFDKWRSGNKNKDKNKRKAKQDKVAEQNKIIKELQKRIKELERLQRKNTRKDIPSNYETCPYCSGSTIDPRSTIEGGPKLCCYCAGRGVMKKVYADRVRQQLAERRKREKGQEK